MMPKKYKSVAEHIAAAKEYQRKYYQAHRDKLLPRMREVSRKARRSLAEQEGRKIKKYRKRTALPPSAAPADLLARIDKLETELKEILLSLDECLKENKKLENLIKWGKEQAQKTP